MSRQTLNLTMEELEVVYEGLKKLQTDMDVSKRMKNVAKKAECKAERLLRKRDYERSRGRDR